MHTECDLIKKKICGLNISNRCLDSQKFWCILSVIHNIFHNTNKFVWELLVKYGWHFMNFEPNYAHKTTVRSKV